nr:MAG TPA: hypothetical protein [Inoviridae sp.]
MKVLTVLSRIVDRVFLCVANNPVTASVWLVCNINKEVLYETFKLCEEVWCVADCFRSGICGACGSCLCG